MMQTTTPSSAKTPAYRGGALVQTVTSVGTVVALTTTILAPALIGLRDRNRQAVCTARIGMLTRAMLLYAAEYDETPPFMGLGWEDIHYDDEPSKDLWSTQEAPNDIPTKSRWGWAVAESWVTQNPELLWNGTLPEEDWPDFGVGLSTGLLFEFARFENVYRCPEFERITDPDKSQNAFNYTRTVLGRKWIMSGFYQGDPEPDYWGSGAFGAVGTILKTSQVFKPSLLSMLHDEWWLRHVGSSYLEHSPPRDVLVGGGWMANDCQHFLFGDEIGQYHGRGVFSEYFPRNDEPLNRDPNPVKRGSVAYYDGHVALERQWWVAFSEQHAGTMIGSLQTIVRFLGRQIFAARGIRIMPS